MMHVLFSILNELFVSISDHDGVKGLGLASHQEHLNQIKYTKQYFSDIGHQAE